MRVTHKECLAHPGVTGQGPVGAAEQWVMDPVPVQTEGLTEFAQQAGVVASGLVFLAEAALPRRSSARMRFPALSNALIMAT